MPLTCGYAFRGGGLGPPPSAMRPWPPDSGAGRATDEGGRSTDDEGGRSTDDEGAGHGRGRKNPRTARARAVSRPSAGAVSRPSDRLSGFDLEFQDSHSLSAPPSSRSRSRNRTRRPLLHPAQQSRFPMKRPVLSGTSVVVVARVGWISDVGARDTGR